MLVLARKVSQQIVIGENIYVKVVRMDKDVVKLGIQAPASIPVHRQEVYEEIQRSNQQALTRQNVPLPRLPKFAIPAAALASKALPTKTATP